MKNRIGFALAMSLLLAAMAAPARAQNVATAADDRAALVELIEERPAAPSVNTALAFTNTWPRAVKVRLEAFNHHGRKVGEGELEIPPHGLRYFFVSRLVQNDDLPFVGWVGARTSLPVVGSAVLLGIGTTDLPVERFPSLNADAATRRSYGILFPLTAAY